MFEFGPLRLRKARADDWRSAYDNVWSHAESARFMMWTPSFCVEDAKSRIERTIRFQTHVPMYFICDRQTDEVIGFAGYREVEPRAYEEMGICLGPRFVGRGYGRLVLRHLIAHCAHVHNAERFYARAWSTNDVSLHLIRSEGFRECARETIVKVATNTPQTLISFVKTLALPS